MTKTLTIDGMSCDHCVAAVTKALEGVAGVSSARVDLASKQAKLELSAEVSDEVLREAIDEIGFEVVAIS